MFIVEIYSSYVMLWQVSGFFLFMPVSPINKTDCHNITEILLKVALNTTIQHHNPFPM